MTSPLVVRAVVLALAIASPCCGPGATAQAVRPEDKTAHEALGETPVTSSSLTCSKAPDKGEPLIVDWKTAEQLDLTVTMQKGVAVVAYDCKSIRLLKDCSVKGTYGFTAVPSVLQEAVQIDDADEVQANLPLGGISLSGEVSRGSSIDIALAYVGKQSALNEAVSKTELAGSECAAATHYVRGATVGAFLMTTGTKGKVRAAADIFGAGAAGESSSTKKKLNSGGDVKACRAVEAGLEKPPEGCGALIRLDLLALGAAVPAKEGGAAPPLENTCVDGFVPSDGRCVKKSRDVARRCEPDDIQDCNAQCDKGNADSCYNAGAYLQSRRQEGTELYLRKACEGNVGRACSRLAIIYAPGLLQPDPPKSFMYAQKGCDLLVPQACVYEGEQDKTKSWPERADFFRRACDLGYFDGCRSLARVYLEGREGSPRKTQEGLAILVRACEAGTGKACGGLAELYNKGKLFSGMETDVQTDAAKSTEYQQRACERGASGAFMKCPPK
jgi:uncharacterized protein